MQITLNEQNLDFSLEKEETINEIVLEIRQWLESSGFILTGLKKDGETLSLEKSEAWGRTLIDDVDVLSVEAQSRGEVRYDMLTTVLGYLSLLENGLVESKTEVVADLMKEYPDIKISLGILLSNWGAEATNMEVDVLDTALHEFGVKDGSFEGKDQQKTVTIIRQIQTLVVDRMRELSDPLREILIAARLLKTSINEISDVAVLLQTGKDQQAMNAVIKFTELSQKIIRLYPLLEEAGILNTSTVKVDGVPFEEFYRKLNDVLKELLGAFEASDSVLIGDLLEYEVAPHLEKLITILEMLNKDTSGRGRE